MAVVVQAIHYTSRPRDWHALAVVLGLTPAGAPDDVWSEFEGDGILAIHGVDAGDVLDGTTDIHLLVDDLDGVAAALEGVADVSRSVLEDVGLLVSAQAASGVRVTASAGAREAVGGMLIQPIWYDTDTVPVRAVLEAAGLRPRIASDSGTWMDFTAPSGGSVAFHAAQEAGVVLGMEYAGDVEALQRRLEASHLSAEIVDEAYNRTLLVDTPDGTKLWINGAMTDLYGYRRAGA
ncbi:hypothetical protein PU630_07150 [Microbacterium horticulturae]|uniref:PAS domain-containing protein n=1 Tax=Microbacterium horticulturae TaxID=3028316 RepID=A0ABY8C670_9MICO|nr:hypothetical protein [Microbacterium sp. KACC 23027]WEG10318.1 hypothetical protein PU630_07150 [Microbacterium sp. KACC 23027]